MIVAEITEMLPTILSQLRAENFSSALRKLATSAGNCLLAWYSVRRYAKSLMQPSKFCQLCGQKNEQPFKLA